MRKTKFIVSFLLVSTLFMGNLYAQDESWSTERKRPEAWNQLVYGGRFMDRFLPMPTIRPLTRNTWGADNVKPRDVANGIERSDFSFWCGSLIQGDDQKYHLMVCAWPEKSPKGHAYWPNSVLYNTVSDSPFGPFIITDTIGKGHNAEVFKTKDGHYVVYVIGGYYVSNSINGPWKYAKFEFQKRNRDIIEGLSNLTFAQREDGSELMICRGGGVWISQNGLSPYQLITQKRAYPDITGEFEDPVVWRDNVQYNLIVNDWYGRTAYYLRSKDGVNWITESGEAYMPGIAKYSDGTEEKWFKYERMKVFQDKYGRALQANFAVIDVEKYYDLENDIHSSKNIAIPLQKGKLISILNKSISTSGTKLKVKVLAENDFNPQKDLDISSLTLGDPEKVNYGKGGRVIKVENDGADLILTFDKQASEFSTNEFAAKLLGKLKNGELVFGYARLPWVNYLEPLLSPTFPDFKATSNGYTLTVEVQNFGQKSSSKGNVSIYYTKENKKTEIATSAIESLQPYAKTKLQLNCATDFEKGREYSITVQVNKGEKKCEVIERKITIVP